MKNEPLMLRHPFERLELYDLDPSKWDYAAPPELWLVDDSALVPLISRYMPPLNRVEVEGKDRVEFLEDGQSRHFFKLACNVDGLWPSFFKKNCGNFDAVVNRNMLILRSDPKNLEKSFDEIANCRIHKATNDYRRERDALVWRVFEKMKRREMCECTEAEIRAELQNYRRKQNERVLAAQGNGCSVPFLVQNFNQHYREILENKFTHWWGKILDDVTIRRYRTLFEHELLVV